jgi:LPS export ABC transporter protein LptC
MKTARISIIYIASGFIAASLIFAGYFFFKKPEKIPPPPLAEGKSAIVFKDVKYSGEKKGTVDWEIRGTTGKKYIDKPLVEIEQMEGEYKPKAGTRVRFKGSKGSMDTEKETGTVEDVSIIYNDDYTLTTKYLDFDFQKGVTNTRAPVTIAGSQLTLMGVGLTANTREETIRIERNVTGFIETRKGKFRFAADTFIYYMKDNRYLLDGNAMMSGEDMKVNCSKLYIYTDGEDLEKVDARGKVRLFSKGSVAKSEQAVYHFKDGKGTSAIAPKAEKEQKRVAGKVNPIKIAGENGAGGKSKSKQEQR